MADGKRSENYVLIGSAAGADLVKTSCWPDGVTNLMHTRSKYYCFFTAVLFLILKTRDSKHLS